MPPTRAILIIRGASVLFKDWNRVATRRSPNVPNFRSRPARIIEPATGASTWALGNQRWVKKRGVLMRKARIKIIHRREGYIENKGML